MRCRRVRISGVLLICAVLLFGFYIFGTRAGIALQSRLEGAAGYIRALITSGQKMPALSWVGSILWGDTSSSFKDEGQDLEVQVLGASPEPTAVAKMQDYTGTRSKVLIYHTHTNEAYEQTVPAYAETGKWRTDDIRYNVVQVGKVLSEDLSTYGFTVLHDCSDYANPKLSTAYSRSLTGILKWKSEQPDIKYFIDIHRDAYSASSGNPTVMINGKKCARISIVIGRADDKTLYPEQPQWQLNLKLAQAIEKQLNANTPGIFREIIICKERFNQHVSPNAVLIEIGNNANTLNEAENAAQYLAEALSKALT